MAEKNLENEAMQDDFFWEDVDYSPEEKERLAKLYAGTVSTIAEKQIMKGTVVSFDDKEVVVNVGFKSDGVIPRAEFKDIEDLHVGMEVEVFLQKVEDSNGHLLLSRRLATSMRSWDKIIEALDQDIVVEGVIKRRTKGGFVVDLDGIIDLNWVIDGSFKTAYMQKLIGSLWTTIDTFDFNGNLVYYTEDKQPLYNYNNVFRVRYLDENGNEGFSNIAEVYLDKAPDDYLVIYPNPVQNNEFTIRLMSSQETPVQIKLYNELGQLLLDWSRDAKVGLNEWVIRNDKLSLGIYHLVVQTQSKAFNQKLVVFK